MISPCEQLDAFFDGELSPVEAAAFRDHLATCTRCQDQLRGRMVEAAVVGDGAPIHALPVRRAAGRRVAYVGIATALAASAALAWWLHGGAPSKHPTDPLAVAISIERGPTTMRGTSAHVGDVLHATSGATIWIYRGEHELVCAGAGRCDVKLTSIGSYSVVTLSGGAVPAPHGDLDTDVAAALDAGAHKQIETVDVQ